MTLTPQQTALLLAIARYRYLTNSQLARLGLGCIHAIRRATRYLSLWPSRSPLLAVQKFPVHARFGRLEHLYRLSRSGLGQLAELYPEASWLPQAPLSGTFALDYAHRKAVINFRIALDRALRQRGSGFRCPLFRQYFEKPGANHHQQGRGGPLTALTRVTFSDGRFCIPDAIFTIENCQRHWRALFALECVMGNKTQRTLGQVHKHLQALAEGTMTTTYGFKNQDYVALFLFEQEALMFRVIDRLSHLTRFVPFRGHVLLTTIADANTNVQRCWRTVGDAGYLFHFITGKKSFRLPP